ncbi:MAG: hypothetical protein U0183_09180 [Polyangiaceae bacterium]
MQKLLLFSLLVFTLLIPLFASNGVTTKQAIQRSVGATIAMCLLYMLGLLFVYPGLEKRRR